MRRDRAMALAAQMERAAGAFVAVAEEWPHNSPKAVSWLRDAAAKARAHAAEMRASADEMPRPETPRTDGLKIRRGKHPLFDAPPRQS